MFCPYRGARARRSWGVIREVRPASITEARLTTGQRVLGLLVQGRELTLVPNRLDRGPPFAC